jgi:hypothetical protein
MAAAPDHPHAHLVGRCHRRAFAEAEHAGRQPRHVVHREYDVARELREQPVVEHPLRAAEPFLRRLENQVQRAAEAPALGQAPGRREQHCRVPVVAARVHHAIAAARMREPGRLADRQRVHVRTQPEPLPGAARERADHAGAAQAARDPITPCCQTVGDERARRLFFETELGMRVQPMAQRDHLGLDGRHFRRNASSIQP